MPWQRTWSSASPIRNHGSRRLFFEPTVARRTRTTSHSQRASSVVSSRWFKRWTRRDHSDDPKVAFSGPGKNKGNGPDRGNSNAPGKGNGPDRGNSNAPDKDNDLGKESGPGEWTERVAVDRA